MKGPEGLPRQGDPGGAATKRAEPPKRDQAWGSLLNTLSLDGPEDNISSLGDGGVGICVRSGWRLMMAQRDGEMGSPITGAGIGKKRRVEILPLGLWGPIIQWA